MKTRHLFAEKTINMLAKLYQYNFAPLTDEPANRVDTPFVATLPLVATFTDKHSLNKKKSR